MRSIALCLLGLLGCAPLPSDGAPIDAAATLGDAAADQPAATGDAAADRPATTAADAAPASYEAVRAIFERSCSGYCHAGGSDVGASLVLASHNGSVPALVNRPTRQVPRVMLVVPGDPDASYLMRKINGTMSELPECAADPRRCGIPMPYAWRDGGPAVVMPIEERDVIRRWIAAGAPGPAEP